MRLTFESPDRRNLFDPSQGSRYEQHMSSKRKVIVNAIPMTRMNTGIARYLRCLYSELEEPPGQDLDIWYFDGRQVTRSMPSGPQSLTRWSRLADMFWRLPWSAALCVRMIMQLRTENRFSKLARDFDIYHEAGFFPMSAGSHVRTLFTVHDMSLFRYPEHHPKERVRFAKMFWEKRCLMVDHFLTVSRFTREELQRYLPSPSQTITVTPLAHDPDLFYPRSMDHVQAPMKSRELPEIYFLFVGSGDPRKNMLLIPRALQMAAVNAPLVVAGWSGWSKKHLPNNVIPLGFVPDAELALLYSRALALVFPSTYEGFGLPVLEAMACGCPVVTTKEASLPEVAGDAAVYVNDPSDPHELGSVLKELAGDETLRGELRDLGLARSAEFSWKRTAELTLGALLDEGPLMGIEEAASKGT